MRAYNLTSQQQALLNFIRSFRNENGFAPSFDEMKDALGLASKSNIHRLVECLVERGLVRKLPERARSIVLIEGDRLPLGWRCPGCGGVHAPHVTTCPEAV